ncbi:MAG TPA: aldo/keto reductase [Myxococcaceae bacterium]
MASKRSRREFMRLAGVGAATLATQAALAQGADAGPAPQGASAKPAQGPIPKRKLGKTGVDVSILALGGHHLGQLPSQEEATRLVHEAMDHGLTFFDNAHEYHAGKSEQWLGQALEGRRQNAFVMTKVCTHGRDKRTATLQLEESLKRLKTDYLDLWQVHEVAYADDPKNHYAKDGVLEALTQAKKSGKVRFVGFTGHKSPELHLDMLRRGYPFDVVQMPLNPLDGTWRSFEQEVLPVLQKRDIAALGMKTLGGDGAAVKAGVFTAEESLRYVLSLPIAAVVSGIDSRQVLHQNLNIARGFQPMRPEEREALRARVKAVALTGQHELYKSSRKYEGPPGRIMHGLPLES